LLCLFQTDREETHPKNQTKESQWTLKNFN
jgi:hypothetical protein